ncbi:MAG: hypothetical protein AAGH81_08580 [Bacteroidota bacterium]
MKQFHYQSLEHIFPIHGIVQVLFTWKYRWGIGNPFFQGAQLILEGLDFALGHQHLPLADVIK